LKVYEGIVINLGIVYGKAYKLRDAIQDDRKTKSNIDQLAVLETALAKSTQRLQEQITTSQMLYPDAVSAIFEAHKLMVNDPLIIDRAKELIRSRHSAYDSYRQAADEVIEKFLRLDNEYIRNRVIDIEDTTDRVLATIEDVEYDRRTAFGEPTILVVEKMKPSLLLGLDKDMIVGLISETGSYNQHSGTIIRTRDIPAMVISGSYNSINDGDRILLDAYKGHVYVNPDQQLANRILKEGDDD